MNLVKDMFMTEYKIKDLSNGLNDVDIIVTVDFLGYNNKSNRGYGDDYILQQSMVKDETGEIKMTFWNDDAKKVKEGSKVQIIEGYVSMYKGELQLNANKEKGLKFLKK